MYDIIRVNHGVHAYDEWCMTYARIMKMVCVHLCHTCMITWQTAYSHSIMLLALALQASI